MKIQIQAELLGDEIISIFGEELKKASVTATPADIKTEVLNKDNKWVPFDPAKIRFSYSK